MSGVAIIQGELDFNRNPTAPSLERHGELVAALRGKGWVTSRELAGLGFDERELRLIGEHDADGEILSYPGSPGYCLFDEASLEEIRKADALKRQCDGMMRKWSRYQRRLHRRGGAAK